MTHAHFGRVWRVNCHSMPAVSSADLGGGAGEARARTSSSATCDGTDLRGRPSPGSSRAVLSDTGYDVKVNDPYKGVELVRALSDPGRRTGTACRSR